MEILTFNSHVRPFINNSFNFILLADQINIIELNMLNIKICKCCVSKFIWVFFTHLKLLVAVKRHDLKWVNIWIRQLDGHAWFSMDWNRPSVMSLLFCASFTLKKMLIFYFGIFRKPDTSMCVYCWPTVYVLQRFDTRIVSNTWTFYIKNYKDV